MEEIADIIDRVLSHPGDEIVRQEARERVARLCAAYPLYGGV